MEWREIIEDPSLRNLPFKIETNEWGKIVMTPATGTHAIYQWHIISWFARFGQGGKALPECPIQTSKGVRVADVAWGSVAFFKKYGSRIILFVESPEIVVEVESPSNSSQEMDEKKQLYFEAGAKEVWLCDEEGDMHFFSPQGDLKKSELFEEFPEHIDIDIV